MNLNYAKATLIARALEVFIGKTKDTFNRTTKLLAGEQMGIASVKVTASSRDRMTMRLRELKQDLDMARALADDLRNEIVLIAEGEFTPDAEDPHPQ